LYSYTLTILYAVLKITSNIPEPKHPMANSVSGILGFFFTETATAGEVFKSSHIARLVQSASPILILAGKIEPAKIIE
jgi:hypothetical protein